MSDVWNLVGMIHVSGEPKPQPRPRAFVRPNGKAGTYDNGKAKAWKQEIIVEAIRAKFPKRLVGPIRLQAEFYLPRPERLRKKDSPTEAVPHINVPDIDNLLKAVMDALSVYGLWKDDRQVAEVAAYKRYVGLDVRQWNGPHAVIEISQMEE